MLKTSLKKTTCSKLAKKEMLQLRWDSQKRKSCNSSVMKGPLFFYV